MVFKRVTNRWRKEATALGQDFEQLTSLLTTA